VTAVVDAAAEEEIARTRDRTIARRKRLMRRARSCCVWFVAISVVAGLGTWAFVALFLYADQRAGERALAEARAEGTPLTLEGVTALAPKSPEIREATNLWRNAIERIDHSFVYDPDFAKVPVIGMDRTDEGARPPDRGAQGRLQGEDLAAAIQFAAPFEQALEAARAARDAGGVANFATSADAGFINAYSLTYLSSVLRLRAETKLARDDVEGALDDLATMVACSDALRYEPYEWQQRGRHQTLESAVDLLERMLAVEELDDDQLKRLSETLVDRNEAASFRLALAGSRLQFVELVQRNDEAVKGMLGIERSRWTRGADLAKGLDIYRRMDDASEQGLIEAVDAWKPIEAELTALAAEPSAQVRFPGTLYMTPQLGAQAQSHLQAQAAVVLARTAIACERYRVAHDKLPAKLDDLAPEFLESAPRDPCDGKPLRYVNDAGGVRLYSIGGDLIDQGGGAPTGSGALMFTPSDVVFRLKKSRANDQPPSEKAP
jgi:hypothetical protein